MKKLLKRLTPNAFQRIDDYLLRNYPTVWRTRIHVVLPLAVLAAILLFIAGYFIPNSFGKPLVDPLRAIQITKEKYFLMFFLVAVVIVFYWGYTLYLLKFNERSSTKVWLSLSIYGIGLFTILGFNTIAFRVGTIVRSTKLINKEDLSLLKNKNYFLYGLIAKNTALDLNSKEEVISFEEDTMFQYLWENENEYLLSKRYKELAYHTGLVGSIFYWYVVDNTYSSLSNSPRKSSNDYSYRNELSYKMYEFYRVPENKKREDIRDIAFLSNMRLDIDRDMSDLFSLEILTNNSLTYLDHKSSSLTLCKLLDPSYNVIESNFYDSKLLSTYDNYYLKKDSVHKNHIRSKYNLSDYRTFSTRYYLDKIDVIQKKISSLELTDNDKKEFAVMQKRLDTIKAQTPNLTFHFPVWFYELETKMRTVKHAEQYIEEILPRYFRMVLEYLPFVLLLFFTASFLSQKEVLATFIICLIMYFLADYVYSSVGHAGNSHSKEAMDMPFQMYKGIFLSCCMTAISMLSIIISSIATFINYENKVTDFFLHLFVVAAIGTALIPIFVKGPNVLDYCKDGIFYVKNYAFYLTAALCLIAPVLFSYLKGLPKSR